MHKLAPEAAKQKRELESILQAVRPALKVTRGAVQAALELVKGTRGRLANTLAEVRANVAIAEQQRQRQRLEELAESLMKLRQAFLLHAELK